jgi:arylsulfatase A-like enzyme
MPERPNVLVILCDQLRRDALSCYGDPNLHTPHLDRLAASGVRFTNACSTYPICVPFRFTLMTGEYAHTRLIPGIEWRMSPRERTLAHEFGDAGYETLYVGKWHLYGGSLHLPGYGARHEGVKPIPRPWRGGWQHWRGFELRNAPWDSYYFHDDDPVPRKLPGYQTDALCDLTMDFLAHQRDRSRPFCAVVSVEPPHDPFQAPPELEAKWRARDLKLPANFMVQSDDPVLTAIAPKGYRPDQREQAIRDRQHYYAMVENLDQNVGRLLAFLEREGLRESTQVVFLSDHGEFGGAHALHQKQLPYEESCGIPLLVAGPGVPAGRVIAEPIATEDLFPTLLGLAGLPPRRDVPGHDFAPRLRGTAPAPERPGVMLQFVSEIRPNMPLFKVIYRGFRSARYKYTVAGDYRGAQPWQFFDLQEDPHELHNRLADPALQPLIADHHRWLRERMAETLEDAALAPAYGQPGLNLEWQPTA